jgi:hypothetical protein
MKTCYFITNPLPSISTHPWGQEEVYPFYKGRKQGIRLKKTGLEYKEKTSPGMCFKKASMK